MKTFKEFWKNDKQFQAFLALAEEARRTGKSAMETRDSLKIASMGIISEREVDEIIGMVVRFAY